MNGGRNGAGHMKQDPLARHGSVESGQTSFDRILSRRFQAPVNIPRPMQI